jgi:cytochrome b
LADAGLSLAAGAADRRPLVDGENERIELHVTLGVVTAGLLLFRLLWGVLRQLDGALLQLPEGPARGPQLSERRSAHALGHNPLGGWSVAAMLAVLTAQVGLGLFAEDNDALAAGPLSILGRADTASGLTEWHEWLFYPILGLIALHVARSSSMR